MHTVYGRALPPVGRRRTAVHDSCWESHHSGGLNTAARRPVIYHRGSRRDFDKRSTARCVRSGVVVHCGRTRYHLRRRSQSPAMCWDDKAHWNQQHAYKTLLMHLHDIFNKFNILQTILSNLIYVQR